MNIGDIFKGVGYFTSSVGYIRHHGLSQVYLWMLGVAVLFTALYAYLVSQAFGYVVDIMTSALGGIDTPDWMGAAVWGVIVTILGWLASALMYVASFLLFHLINGTILLILLSPLFTYIAKKAYEIEMGEKPKELPLIDSVGRGVLFALRNFGVQLLIWILVYAAGFFIPVLAPAVPFVIVAVNSYYYAISMADYTMELRGFGVSQGIKYGSHNKMLFCGIGLPFALLLLVPFIGSYLAILVAPVVEIAAMKVQIEEEKKKREEASTARVGE